MPEAVYIDDLVGESARALRVLAREREITIGEDGDAAVEFVGDETLLRQLIRNLLDNAVRHARNGGAVTTSVRRASSGITIRVTDDGEGVPEAQRERIFRPVRPARVHLRGRRTRFADCAVDRGSARRHAHPRIQRRQRQRLYSDASVAAGRPNLR